MKAWNEITYYGGFDWARDHHDVVIVDRSGQIVADFAIKHTAEGWQRWREGVAALGADNLSYDPDLHARNQLQHGSWLLSLQSP